MARAEPGVRPRDRQMSALRRRLSEDQVLVVDGAMGSMLYQRGVFVNVCYDELNLNRPELVRGVHEAYVRAGAEIEATPPEPVVVETGNIVPRSLVNVTTAPATGWSSWL